MTDLTGQTLGRYRIIEQLGRGGMANVYRAVDLRLDRTVALKIIRSENLEETDFLRRFDREARALAILNHPNIVHINDYGELNGLPYLEMDYIPGGTLEKHLGVLIPWSESARFLAPVAFALEHAHRLGIIHRDIKPSNILITESGEPMITDFGIAKIMNFDQATLVTLPGFGVGTPAYMSPEQVMGKPIDGRSDVYSLGIVLYEMCTGHPPYRAETPMAVAVKQVHDPIPRPRQDLVPLPSAAEKAILTALAKEPEQRYPNMAAFAETLDKLGRKAPVSDSKATFTSIPIPKELVDGGGYRDDEPPRKGRLFASFPFFSQNRALATLLSLVIVVVISTLVFGIGYAQRIRNELEQVSSTSPVLLAPPDGGLTDFATEVASQTNIPGAPALFAKDESHTTTPTLTLSPSPTRRFGNGTTPTEKSPGNPGSGTSATQQPTLISSTAPTSPPPTSPPPTVAPTSPPPTSPPATAEPTNPPAPTNTPKPVNTHKPPTKTP